MDCTSAAEGVPGAIEGVAAPAGDGVASEGAGIGIAPATVGAGLADVPSAGVAGVHAASSRPPPKASVVIKFRVLCISFLMPGSSLRISLK